MGNHWDQKEEKKEKSELENLKKQLVRTSRLASLGEISAGIAHEINNPLLVGRLSAEKLRESPRLNDEDRKLCEKLLKANQRIEHIAKGLLSIARDGPRDQAKPISMSTMAETVIDLCHEKFQRFAIDFSYREASRELAIPCRRGQVEQVLMILISNAIQAVGGQESAGQRRVELAIIERHGRGLFQVEDSGPGIPEEVQERIFEPLFTTKEEGQGTGIGLGLARLLAQENQGEVSIASPRQARFEASFPLAI